MSFLFSQPAPGILPANSVDFSEVETIASNTLLGNNTGSDSVILELSKTQATAMLDVMGAASAGSGGLKGLVPASLAGDQAKFLRADATWNTIDLSGLQPLDSDLTAIAGLSPSDDDLIQRKAGAWVNRTPAQLKTDLSITKSDVGLSNVDNTSDANKPISTATQLALNAKVDSVSGSSPISSSGGTTPTISISDFGGATSLLPGSRGSVPAPAAGDQAKFLRGDATWQTVVAGINTVGAFSGSSQANGATISGNTITFGPADAINPGMMSTGSQTIAGTKTFTGTVKNTNYILSPQLYDAGTQTINFSLDWANGPKQKFTINAAGPLVVTLSNPVTGGTYLLRIEQGATPGTLTWPGTVIWGTVGAPVLSTSTGNVDLVSLFYDGTNYYGSYQIQTALPAANYSLTNLSFVGTNGQVIELSGGVPTWQNKYPAQAGNQYKVLATSGSAASWQFAGLGDGTLPSNTVVLGRDLPSGMTATSGILIGTGSNLGTGASQVIIGASSGRSTTGATGANNTVVGAGSFNAAGLTSAANNVIIGQGNGTALTTGSNHVIIGQNSGTGLTTATSSIIIGQNSARSLTTSATGVIIGYNAAPTLTGGVPNVAIGESVLGNVTTGNPSGVYIGWQSGFANQGQTDVGGSNVFIGNQTGYQNVGSFNTKVGDNAARATGGSLNTFIGYRSGYGLFGQCTNNSALGANSIENITSGSNNTSCGFKSGSLLTTGGSNIFLGANAGFRSTTQSNELFIDNQDRTTYALQQTNSLIYGVFNAIPSSQTFTLNASVTSTYGFIANEIGGDFDTRIEGDNDANLLFVDAGTDRVGIGNNAPAVKLHTQATTASTNTVTNVLRVDSQSSGTPATGIGVGIEMAAETAAGNTEIGVVLEAVTTDVTSTSEDFDLVVKNMAAGATAAETLRVTSTGDVTAKTGNILIDTAGKGLSIKSGSNAKIGTATFTAVGSVTVNTTAVTANSLIFVTGQDGVDAFCVGNKVVGTSFDIIHSTGNVTAIVAWMIVEATP